MIQVHQDRIGPDEFLVGAIVKNYILGELGGSAISWSMYSLKVRG